MKILHLATARSGGAGIATRRIHSALLANGVESTMVTGDRTTSEWPEIQRYADVVPGAGRTAIIELKELWHKIKRTKKNNRIAINSAYFSHLFSPYTELTSLDVYKNADIIHLHWVADFMDYPSFFGKNKKPIVWTLHDMHPFTPGNHYPLHPDEQAKHKALLNRYATKKQKYFENQTIHWAATTQWMKNACLESPIAASSVQLENQSNYHCLPYGFDIEKFQIRDKAHARKLLGLPEDKFIILFAAHYTKERRKGFPLLAEALQHLPSENIAVCIMGNHDKNSLAGIENYPLGYVHDDILLSLVYSAADVFVTPALVEAFGQTTIESMLCGTPVIGFQTGIVGEVVKNGESGFVCESSSAGLAASLTRVLNGELTKNSAQIREEVVHDFSNSKLVNRLGKLYEEIMSFATKSV